MKGPGRAQCGHRHHPLLKQPTMSIMLSLRAERQLALRSGLAGLVAHPGQPGQPFVRLHRPPTAAPAPFPLARAATPR
jgi:hypothetical protein